MKKSDQNTLSADAGTQESAEPQKSEVEDEVRDLIDAYNSGLAELLKEPKTEQRSLKIIEHVIESTPKIERILARQHTPHHFKPVKNRIRDELFRLLDVLLTDDHLMDLAIFHDQGLSRSEAVVKLMRADKVCRRLSDAMGWTSWLTLRDKLISYLAYFKPGHPDYPDTKQLETYREEQVALLVNQVQTIDKMLETGAYDDRNNMVMLTGAIVRAIQLDARSVRDELSRQLDQLIEGLKHYNPQKKVL